MIHQLPKSMWEILVPTMRPTGEPIKTRCHKAWDEKVRKITNGLTISAPAKGQWIDPRGELAVERILPVRILATDGEMNKIVDMTIKHYEQEAVLAYKISTEYILRYAKNPEKTDVSTVYSPGYGDDNICTCGHPYYRHFDTYEDMRNIGCKYCPCDSFVFAKIQP